MSLSDTGLAALPHSRGRLLSPWNSPRLPPVTSEFHTGAFHRRADGALHRVYGTNSWLRRHPRLGGIPKSIVKVITFTPTHIRACLWSASIKTIPANMQLFNECVSPRRPKACFAGKRRFHPYRSELGSRKQIALNRDLYYIYSTHEIKHEEVRLNSDIATDLII